MRRAPPLQLPELPGDSPMTDLLALDGARRNFNWDVL
jgi:hypothetical protein